MSLNERLQKLLERQKKKTILTSEIEKELEISGSETLYSIIQRAVTEEILEPVKSSGKNGNRQFPLFQKYRICTKKPDYSNLLCEMRKLNPQLLENGYLLHHPKQYERWKNEFAKLSSYLFQHLQIDLAVSRKERSFEIFQEEKLLDDRDFWGLLQHLGLTQEKLAFYDTPDNCLCDYIRPGGRKLCLLICENKDIWFNLRRMLFEDGCGQLWGIVIDGVVYGQGNYITHPGLLTEYTRFLPADSVEYLYWGDIDREGLFIYHRTCQANPDLAIKPFVPGYEKMLQLAKGMILPKSNDQRGRMPDASSLRTEFAEQTSQAMLKILEENDRLPQEIISYAYLKEHMR